MQTARTRARVEEPPRHRPNFVEALDRVFGLGAVDDSGLDQKPQVAVDLLGGRVGNSPEVQAMSRVLRTGYALARISHQLPAAA